jgi:hypothetical protein
VRCAAYDRRVMAVVAVTPPFDPARWINHASPLLVRQVWELAGDDTDVATAVDRYSLHEVVPLLKCPLLVFGAGRDLVAPPAEAQLLAARAGALGSLLWYPGSGHCLYDSIPAWTGEAATWISSVASARHFELQTSGFADPVQVAAIAREQLQAAGQMDDDFFDDEGSARLIEQHDDEMDDIGAYARLVTPPAQSEGPSDTAT